MGPKSKKRDFTLKTGVKRPVGEKAGPGRIRKLLARRKKSMTNPDEKPRNPPEFGGFGAQVVIELSSAEIGDQYPW